MTILLFAAGSVVCLAVGLRDRDGLVIAEGFLFAGGCLAAGL